MISVLFGVLFVSSNVWLCCKGDYIPKWSCDFENGLCHWLQVHDDHYDWSHVSGTRDLLDHTTNSINGKLLLISGWKLDVNDEAKLMSAVLKANNGSCKMIFYHRTNRIPKFGNTLSTKVHVVTKSADGRSLLRKLVFSSINQHIADWRKTEVPLISDKDFQVEISGTAGYGREYVALDDIFFTDSCRTNEQSSVRIVKLDSSPSHNFPEGLFYKQLNGSWSMVCTTSEARSACRELGLKDVLDGKGRHSATVPSNNTIVSNTTSPSNETVASSNTTASNKTLCLPANLTVPTATTCSASPGCLKVKHWRCAQDYLSMCPKLTHVKCTSSVDNPKCVSQTQVCDFVRDCPGGEDESNCLNLKRCDFHTDVCDWVIATSSRFKWERHNGPTDTGSNSYYMRATNYNQPSVSGIASLRMRHQIKGLVNSSCTMRFFYVIRRNDGAKIKLNIKENNKVETIWSKPISYWHDWRKAVVELPLNRTYHLFLEAYFEGINGQGEVGFNNVSFVGGCQFTNYTPPLPNDTSNIFICRTGEVIQNNVLCDFHHDCYDGHDESNCTNTTGRCTFETSICDWQFGKGVKMIRKRFGTPSRGTGPNRDHTTSHYFGGYYVYHEASNHDPGVYSDLISRQFQQPKSKRCTFRWFYHMYSTYTYDMGKLNILYHDPATGAESVLWTKQNNQGIKWKYGKVTFDVNTAYFKIIIRAITGSTFRSDIAIDDVSFSSDCFDVEKFQPINIQQNCNGSGKFYSQSDRVGSLFSPGFPSNYPNNVTCHWRITSDPRLRINITSHVFQTERNDVVSIDAGTINATVIGGNFSGTKGAFFMVSSNNVADVWFTPDHSISSYGFLINVTATLAQAQAYTLLRNGINQPITVIQDCSSSSAVGRVTRQYYQSGRGTITPPQYGSNYHRNLNCNYKFFTSFGYRIKFLFTDFKTESTHDYIQVHNNGIPGATRFSGNRDPFSFVSYRNDLWLLFRTDHSVQYRGFNLDFQVTLEPASPARLIHAPGAVSVSMSCRNGSSYTRTYQTGNGTITQGRYRNLQNCLYQFTAPVFTRIWIAFPHFDLERNYDYLRVLNDAIPGYLQSISGNRSPFYFISKTNSISLRFTTDGSVTRTGFVLQFSVTIRAARALTDDATITTRPPPTTRAPLTTGAIGLLLRTGMAMLSPTTTAPTTRWSGNTFLRQSCGYYTGLMTGDSQYGAIKSPNYPISYPNLLYCTWSTRYWSYSRRYVLYFEYFDTEYNRDYVYVRDGPYSYSPLLKSLSGRRQHSKPILTSSSQFYIQFTSNYYRSNTGFRVRYSTYPGCFYCRSGFFYRITITTNPLHCMQRCKSSGYAYVYIIGGSSCYCGGFYGTFYSNPCTLKHPSQCNRCSYPYSNYKCGSHSYGSMYAIDAELSTPRPVTTTPYTPFNPWWTTPYNQWQTNPYWGRRDKSVKHSSTAGTVIGSIFGVSAFIAILCAICYVRYKKRRLPQTRTTTGPSTGGANTAHSRQMPVAYFVPASTQNGAPPSYTDAMNGRVYFLNNVYGTQTLMKPVSLTHEAPPSFVEATSGQAGEKPPIYDAVSNEMSQATTVLVQGAQAAEPVRNVSPIPPKPDNGLQVSMPGVEEPAERPPSRNNEYQSLTSLREAAGTGFYQRLIAPPQRNPARSLPPIQRVRAVHNTAFDEDVYV